TSFSKGAGGNIFAFGDLRGDLGVQAGAGGPHHLGVAVAGGGETPAVPPANTVAASFKFEREEFGVRVAGRHVPPFSESPTREHHHSNSEGSYADFFPMYF